ncbi:MAG: tRNA lysidine(34) synthetase TilS [Chlorobi bacterium]|nr:tRNA lysidine(34) synthetase TilS [Chlorobiota bacterium]
MLTRFKQIIASRPNDRRKKYLVAVSGGADSMVLLDLMRKAGLDVAAVHCNFKLRGRESDEDAEFVRQITSEWGIPLHLIECPAGKGGNLQERARDLRYLVFDELADRYGYDHILTAHHADDAAETFLINLGRGSGLQGLTGIGESGRLKRPLLGFTRREILDYARRHGIPWREDSSNRSDRYLRNRIRNELLPLWVQIEPRISGSLTKTMAFLSDSARLEKDWFLDQKNKHLRQEGEDEILPLEAFDRDYALRLFLYHWLTPHGFDPGEAWRLTRSGTGKYLVSGNKRLVKHGNTLILGSIPPELSPAVFSKIPREINRPVRLKFTFGPREHFNDRDIYQSPPHTIYVDADKFQPPLTVRPWKEGDRFRPMGMKGSKKVADLLAEQGVPRHRKNQTYILFSGNTPVWIIGHRPDDRFKITPSTRHVWRIDLLKERK